MAESSVIADPSVSRPSQIKKGRTVRLRLFAWWAANANQVIEIAGIILFAAWIGRPYLDLDPSLWPKGLEFPMSIQSHYIWQNFLKCGACVFWNGFLNGGAPAFVELHGAPLHPLVIITSLIWGPVNGGKIIIVASLAMAGLAQWWLGKVLGLGRVARLWGAALGVVGGHMFGRLEMSLVPLVLSVASTALVIPASLDLALHRGRKRILVFAAVLALAALSGQGYLQVGLLFSLFPALLIFLFDQRARLQPAWKDFVLAGLLVLLLTAPLWVPLAHFWPNLGKDIDPNYASAQPLEYGPLNLLIRDPGFYRTDALGKQPFAYQYIIYIGWLPVFFALAALRLVPRSRLRELAFLIASFILVFLVGEAVTLRLFSGTLLKGIVEGIRHPTLITSLSVPFLIGISAWGLDLLITRRWPSVSISLGEVRVINLRATWILVIPALLAVYYPYKMGKDYIVTFPEPVETQQVGNYLRTPSAQWVRPPYGEMYWVPRSLAENLKLTIVFRPWHWRDREFPQPDLLGQREVIAPDAPGYAGQFDGVYLSSQPQNQYAVVQTAGKVIPCQAQSTGGYIDVNCQTDSPGVLTVQENSWVSWYAAVDGKSTVLESNKWLQVAAPAGNHHFSFRYLPWDVPLGILISMVGLGLVIYLWRKPEGSSLAPA